MNKIFLILGIFCIIPEIVSAQYDDQTTIMSNHASKTAALIAANEIKLDSKTALQLLKEKQGKRVAIKRLAVGNKNIAASEMAKALKASTVVFASAYDCGRCPDTHIDPASGYVIDADGIVATNYHVVKAFTTVSRNNVAMTVQMADGGVYPVTDILSSSETNDLCIVRVDTKGQKLKPLPIGEPAMQGDEVFVMSHPAHMFYYLSKGIVARNYLDIVDAKTKVKGRIMDITADYAGGSSGGPIVDAKGNLVATVSSTRSLYYSPMEQKDLQMVIKATKPVICLKELIEFK